MIQPTNKNEEQDEFPLSYLDAAHAIQSGVKFTLELDEADKNKKPENRETSPKHLCTGVNLAMVENSALVRLLVDKGIITLEEFTEELRKEANRHVQYYEKSLEERLGSLVILR